MNEDAKSKLYAVIAALALATGAGAYAAINPLQMLAPMVTSALHVWNSGDVLRATDLNANFSLLNTTKVGGGVPLTNADVSNVAAISHSKLATPALVPKAWAHIASTCAASPCTIADSSQVTSVARTGAGVYTIALSYTPANTNFAQLVTAHVAALYCATTATSTSAPHITLRCYDAAGAATDAAFSFLVMDT